MIAKAMLRMLACLSLLVGLAACGGGGGGGGNNPPTPPTPTTYTVTASIGTGTTATPATQQVLSGQTATLTVGLLSGYNSLVVTGGGGTLNGTTYTTGPITSNTTITTSATKILTISSITVAPRSAQVGLSSSQQFSASVTGTADPSVEWSVNGIPGGSNSVGSISSTGLYTAPSQMPSEAIFITVKSLADSSKSDQVQCTVVSTLELFVSPQFPMVESGQQLKLVAQVTGSADTAVRWRIVGSSGSITLDGTFTAPLVVQSQLVQVVAEADADPNKMVSTQVNVVPQGFVGSIPGTGESNVPVNGTVCFRAQDPLLPTSVNGSSVTLKSPTQDVPGDIWLDANQGTVTFHPRRLLDPGTQYTFQVSGAIRLDGSQLPSYQSTFTTVNLLSQRGAAQGLTSGAVVNAGVHSPIVSDGSFSAALNPYGVTVLLAYSADGAQALGGLAISDGETVDMSGGAKVPISGLGTSTISLDDASTAETLVFLSPLLYTRQVADAKLLLQVIHGLPETADLAATLSVIRPDGWAFGDPRLVAPYTKAITAALGAVVPLQSSSSLAARFEIPGMARQEAPTATIGTTPTIFYGANSYIRYDLDFDGSVYTLTPKLEPVSILGLPVPLRATDWLVQSAQMTQAPVNPAVADPNVAYPINASTIQYARTHADTLDSYLSVGTYIDALSDYIDENLTQNTGEPRRAEAIKIPASAQGTYILRAFSGGRYEDPYASSSTLGFIYNDPSFSVWPWSGPELDKRAAVLNLANAALNCAADFAPGGFTGTVFQDVSDSILDDLAIYGTHPTYVQIMAIITHAVKVACSDAVRATTGEGVLSNLGAPLADAIDELLKSPAVLAASPVIAQRAAELKFTASPMETAYFVVGPPATVPAGLKVAPATLSLEVGGTAQLSLTDGSGQPIPSGVYRQWRTSGSLASVDSKGLVTGRLPGSGSIIVTMGGKVAVVQVTVSNPVQSAITIAPSVLNMEAGAKGVVQARVCDQLGNPIPGANVLWSYSGPILLLPDSTGGAVVTATGDGPGTIVAHVGSASGSAVVQVGMRRPSNLAYSANPAAYEVGTQILSNLPTWDGAKSTSYSVSPSLPAGLVLNPTTGIITGTPTAATPLATYIITATNAAGSTTCNLVLTIAQVAAVAPTLTQHPQSLVVTAGQPASFSVLASGNPAPTYQWERSADGSTWSTIPGATSATYVFTTQVGDNGANFRATATNSSGSQTSQVATLTVVAPSGGVFTATGAMAATRTDHAAVLLPNGKVLVLGGCNYDDSGTLVFLYSAEVYDPFNGTFTATGSMATNREQTTATVLANGKVLVAGGSSPLAELYDPASGTFTLTGSMTAARPGSTATRLPNGQVLIVGGGSSFQVGTLSTAELYDPNTGTFTATGSMATARMGHTAVLLSNGKVLVLGGWDGLNGFQTLASAEVYDPATGTFTLAGPMTVPREMATATTLPNGLTLVAGGNGQGGGLSSAETYDPATGTFTATGSMTVSRSNRHTATLLPDGKVLVAGGQDSSGYCMAQADLYDPATGKFTATGSMTAARSDHTATQLQNGDVLITGGQNTTILSSAEVYH